GNALTFRSLPSDPAVAQESIRALLAADHRPTALLCRSDFLAEAAARAIGELSRAVRREIEVMVCEPASPQQCPYACVRPTIPLEEQSRMLGRLIRQLAQNQQPDPAQVAIPVTIQESGHRMRNRP